MKTKTFDPHEVRKFKILNFTLALLFILTLLLAFFITGCESTTETAEKEVEYFSKGNIFFLNWKYSSIPERLKEELDQPLNNKAKCAWYNITPSDIKVDDIVIGQISSEEVRVLDFIFNPDLPAEYNQSDNFSNISGKWGGMMTNILTDTNYFYENKYSLDIWMKIIEAPEDAVLNIDLGLISEEVIPDKQLNYEDKNANNRIDSNEDTGIDGLADASEPGYDSINNPDPNHDNFTYTNFRDFDYMNGTEGNATLTQSGRNPDSEDLNGNYFLDTQNKYYTYSLPLNMYKLSITRNLQGGVNDWFKVRIPLYNYDSQTGDSDFIYPETLRFWVEKADSPVHLKFAEIKFSK